MAALPKKQKIKLSISVLIIAVCVNYLSLKFMHSLYLVFLGGMLASASFYLLAIFIVLSGENRKISRASSRILYCLTFFALLNLFNHYRIGFEGIGGNVIFDVISFLVIMSAVIFINASRKDINIFFGYIIGLACLFLLLSWSSINVVSAIQDPGRSFMQYGAREISFLRSVSFFSIPMVILSFSVARSTNLKIFSLLLLIIYICCGFYVGKRDFVAVIAVLIVTFIVPSLFVLRGRYKDAKGRRPLEYYKKLRSFPSVMLVHPKVSSTELMRKSRVTITIAGTASNEARVLGKPSFALGRPPYLHMLSGGDFSSDFPLSRLYEYFETDETEVNMSNWEEWLSGTFPGSAVPVFHGSTLTIDYSPENASQYARFIGRVLGF